jgi:hypothetical protein
VTSLFFYLCFLIFSNAFKVSNSKSSSIIKIIFFLSVLIQSFYSQSQITDSSARDVVADGFKLHGFVMNMTDIAKISSIKKPMFLGVNGVQ